MATPRKIGGYTFRAAVASAKQANQQARAAIERVITEDIGTAAKAVLLARAALALGEQLDVLQEIEEIGRNGAK
jgi:hypothetical protein